MSDGGEILGGQLDNVTKEIKREKDRILQVGVACCSEQFALYFPNLTHALSLSVV